VLRDYNRLMKEASELGIASPGSYYDKGKVEGGMSRDIRVEGQQSKGEIARDDTDIKFRDEITKEPVDKKHLFLPVSKPSLCDFPDIAGRIRASEIPRLLGVLRLLIKK